MPPWSIEEDGPLNDHQIEQLVMLITSEFSEEGWEFAVEEANHSDAFDPVKHLAEAVNASATTLHLNDASTLNIDGFLRIGGDTIDEPYEALLIVSVDEEANSVEVERGAQSTTPMEHEAGAEVYNGPLEPPTEPITGESGTPPCGQAQAQPAATPGPPVEISGDVTLEMGDNFFSLDGSINPTMQVAAGGSVAFSLPNNGQNIHNLRIAGPDGEYSTDDDFISDPDTITSGSEGTLEISFDAGGTFIYQCDFHPTEMLGEITISE
jgi:plastocyanin